MHTGKATGTVCPVGRRSKRALPYAHRRERHRQRVGVDFILASKREGHADELHVLGAPRRRMEQHLVQGLQFAPA